MVVLEIFFKKLWTDAKMINYEKLNKKWIFEGKTKSNKHTIQLLR